MANDLWAAFSIETFCKRFAKFPISSARLLRTFANFFDVITVAIFVTDVVIGSDVATLLLLAERYVIEIKRFGLVLARTSLAFHKIQHYVEINQEVVHIQKLMQLPNCLQRRTTLSWLEKDGPIENHTGEGLLVVAMCKLEQGGCSYRQWTK